MKAITLRNLPDQVADAVQTKADAEHLSISKAIVRLLEEKIVAGQGKPSKKIGNDLDWFFGSSTKKDGDEFLKTLWKMRKADREMER